jgi:hypothetical protein
LRKAKHAIFWLCGLTVWKRKLDSTHKRTDSVGCGLSRWENEGGASSSEWIEDRDRRTKLADEEKRILQHLGAGVIAQWNDLPTDLQRALFWHATSGGTLPDIIKLKEQIARFLHARSAQKAMK